MNDICINDIKKKGIIWVNKLLDGNITHTKPGSISYLLYGEKPSEQSINIKFGRFGEFLSKELINSNKNLELLTCGVQKVNNKNKDIDLIFKNEKLKIIYYRELKGNIELDTEKLPATIAKCKEIEKCLKQKFKNYSIDCGILNWSIYNREDLSAGLSNIRIFERNEIKIDHMEDFLNVIEIQWSCDSYYDYFRDIGNMIISHQ